MPTKTVNQNVIDLVGKIKPNKFYYLKDILDENLVPEATEESLYRLVTYKNPDKNAERGMGRLLCQTTTKTSIRATHEGKSWNKIKGKIKVSGRDLILFIKLNTYSLE